MFFLLAKPVFGSPVCLKLGFDCVVLLTASYGGYLGESMFRLESIEGNLLGSRQRPAARCISVFRQNVWEGLFSPGDFEPNPTRRLSAMQPFDRRS